jgi:hypothetical protein
LLVLLSCLLQHRDGGHQLHLASNRVCEVFLQPLAQVDLAKVIAKELAVVHQFVLEIQSRSIRENEQISNKKQISIRNKSKYAIRKKY